MKLLETAIDIYGGYPNKIGWISYTWPGSNMQMIYCCQFVSHLRGSTQELDSS